LKTNDSFEATIPTRRTAAPGRSRRGAAGNWQADLPFKNGAVNRYDSAG